MGIEELQKELETAQETETKLQKAIDCMEASLAKDGAADFRTFWDIRKVCLELFKEQMSPSVRTIHWARYSELSKEAYRLKQILDEESAFAKEQIDIAITAVENDLEVIDQLIEKQEPFSLNFDCDLLKSSPLNYSDLQRTLNFFNAQAVRINSLRKELIKTPMRIKQKNKFFKRLSAAGDKIFPRRKELIKEISDQFIKDIDRFFEECISDLNGRGSLFPIREEIKALQGVAKLLTLNSHCFSLTRTKLSECWDKLKDEEKERKKFHLEKKEQFKENADRLSVKIKEFADALKEEKLTINDAEKQLSSILSEMRDTRLGREEVQLLRQEIAKAEKPLKEKKEEEKKRLSQLKLEKEKVRKEKLETLKGQIKELKDEVDTNDLEELRKKLAEVTKNVKAGEFKHLLQGEINTLKELIQEKEEKHLLDIPEDKKQALLQLQEVLKQRQNRRFQVKERVETLRRESGASSLDFEQSLKYNEMITSEKSKLDKIDQGIKEVESQIATMMG